MDRKNMDGFLSILSEKAQPDPITGSDPYQVNSLYFDSEDLIFFFQNIDGIAYRKKLRIRHYGEFEKGDDRWVEIKEKHKSTTIKRRVKIQKGQEDIFLEGQETFEGFPPIDQKIRQEMVYLNSTFKLRPVAYTSYFRRAFMDPAEERVRITVDTDLMGLSFMESGLDFEKRRRVLPVEKCIVEMKGPRRLPLWLAEAVRDYELRRSKMSKYCTVVQQCVR